MNKVLNKILKTLLKRTKAIYATTIDTATTKEYLVDLLEGLLEEDLSYLIKDNPVPSLDNLLLKLRDIRNSDDKIPIKVYNQLCDIEHDFRKLQNGVETNKEQPIKFPTEKETFDYFKDYGFKNSQIEVIKMYIRMIQYSNQE